MYSRNFFDFAGATPSEFCSHVVDRLLGDRIEDRSLNHGRRDAVDGNIAQDSDLLGKRLGETNHSGFGT